MPEITQEELEQFNRYKELGEPDAISASLSERETLARNATINEVAGLTGYKPSVLTKLTEGLDLKVSEGKAFIGDKEITEYAKENWSDFMESLKAPSTPSIPFVRQPTRAGEVKPQMGQLATSYIKRTYGKPAEASVH